MESQFTAAENSSESQPEPSKNPEQITGCADLLILAVLSAGIALVVFIRHFSTLGTTFSPDGAPRIAALIGIGVQFLLLSALLIPLALFWPSPRKPNYQAWLVAHILTMFLAIGFIFPYTAIYLQALFHIIIGLGLLILLIPIHHWFSKIRSDRQGQDLAGMRVDSYASPQDQGQLWLSAGIAVALAALPWVLNGALGSILDTVLMGLVGFIFGVIAALVFRLFFYQPSFKPNQRPVIEYIQDALGFSLFLLLLASSLSFCFGGVQLMIMISLPVLGWLVVFLLPAVSSGSDQQVNAAGWNGINRVVLPVGLLIGLVMSYPLIFLDPDELVLVLSDSASEVVANGFQASFNSALILLGLTILALVVFLVRRGRATASEATGPGSNLRPVRILFASLLVLTSIWLVYLYFSSGQPGFHGDRMFVIMKDQGDLSGIQQIEDYQERRQQAFSQLLDLSKRSQSGIRAVLDRFAMDYTPYYLVNGLDVEGNLLIRIWLSTRPEVDRILQNPILRPLPESLLTQAGPADAPTKPLWNLTLIGADRVWDEFGVRGRGIIIGQSDSGVQGDHFELADSYRGRSGHDNYNWLDPWNSTPSPVDIGGHGTHTLGTILGNTTGVAPDAEWIACVNLARNLANPALYLDCMQFSFAPYPQTGDPFLDGVPALGAHILNNSWGCPEIEGCDAEVFQPAVRALRAAGVFVVGSAGNDGPGCGSLNIPPPIYAEVFAVGAFDQSGELAFFSSIGPVSADQSGRVKPDIVAPGVRILSSLPQGTYGEFSGTSMAGPHVVGTVALMWSANPNLIGDIAATEQILIDTADSYQGNLPDCPGADQLPSTATGYGMLNAYAAVRSALER